MKNKETAINFLKFTSSGRVKDAYERFVHKDFIHHNAYFKGDRESLLKAMEESAKEFPEAQLSPIHVLEDENLVAVFSRINLNPEMTFAVTHVLKFKDGKIIEAWETNQEMLNDSPNENGIF